MRHKQAEIIKTNTDIIKTKADNMELALIVNAGNGWELSQNDFPVLINHRCFLCHKKHTNQVINWLNGGDVYVDYGDDDRELLEVYTGEQWLSYEWYMMDLVESYINIEEPKKPKKEIRYIVVSKAQCSAIGLLYNTCSSAYKFRSDAVDVKNRIPSNSSNLQIIEIEIEVE